MTSMTESFPSRMSGACGTDLARFTRNALEAIAFPGAGLPRGYFCSVTPP